MSKVKEIVEYVFEKAFEPVSIYLQNQRLNALGQVLQGAKDTQAGHRVYLRAMTILEGEFGIYNESNAEVAESHIAHVGEVIPQFRPKNPNEVVEDEYNVAEEMNQVLNEENIGENDGTSSK